VPPLDDKVKLGLPFRTSTQEGAELTWEAAIIALSQSGHVWEAQGLLAIHIGHTNVRALAKPLDILDAVPKKQDTMYSLAYLTMLALLVKSLSWEKSIIDKQLKLWRSNQKDSDSFSCPMDKITDPITTSRAYQRLTVSRLATTLTMERGRKDNEEMTAKSVSDITISDAVAGLQDVRYGANGHNDYLLALETFEESHDVLPGTYLEAMGASRQAIELLHPDVKFSGDSAHYGKVVQSLLFMTFKKGCLNLKNERDALEILKQQDLQDQIMDHLLVFLKGENVDMKARAIGVLGAQSRLPEKAVDALVACLQDGDSTVRSDAIGALGAQSRLPEKAVDALVACLQDGNSTARSRATGALGAQSQLPEKAVDALATCLQDKDSKTVSATIEALFQHVNISERASNHLLDCLNNSKSIYAKLTVIRVLGLQPWLPRSLVDAILSKIDDSDFSIRQVAFRVLYKDLRTASPWQIFDFTRDRMMRPDFGAAFGSNTRRDGGDADHWRQTEIQPQNDAISVNQDARLRLKPEGPPVAPKVYQPMSGPSVENRDMSSRSLRYMLPPTLSLVPDRNIKLGKLIPLSTSEPYLPDPECDLSDSPNYTWPHDTHVELDVGGPRIYIDAYRKSTSGGIWADIPILTAICRSLGFEGSKSENVAAQAQRVETQWFTPSSMFIAHAMQEPSAREHFLKDPNTSVFMITGMKIAYDAEVSFGKGRAEEFRGDVGTDLTTVNVPIRVTSLY
jgi:hypothetical protein